MKKNKTKRILALLVAFCLTVVCLPVSVFATDSNGDNYDDGDVAAIQAIINASPSLKEHYDVNDPGTWSSGEEKFVSWSDDTVKRVVSLNLIVPNDDDYWDSVADFDGTLDASALTAMKDLICAGNENLTKLILPKSASLENVSCYSTGITELDISHNSGLVILECYGTNISKLDVSGNPNLTHLDLEGTKISSLDVSNLLNLETLWCDGTQITSLNVTKNTELLYLHCSNIAITKLDVSKNTKLEILECEETDITELDVSENTDLIWLECYNTNISKLNVSKNTKLETLKCYGTNISELDVSGNPDLKYLDVMATKISSLDVSDNTALESLDCRETLITSLDVSENQSLISLYCPTTITKFVNPAGHTVNITQSPNGGIGLSLDEDYDGNPIYIMYAQANYGYKFVKWNGVTNINDDIEDPAEAYFHITGDMNVSADFTAEEWLTLDSLAIDGVSLTPAFSGDVQKYTAVVEYDVTSVNITAKNDTDYEHNITGTGKHELKVGENNIVVTVTVPKMPGFSDTEETAKLEYVITVTRKAKAVAENTGSTNGNTNTTNEIPNAGDDSRVELWLGLMIISLAGIMVCGAIRRRKRTN